MQNKTKHTEKPNQGRFKIGQSNIVTDLRKCKTKKHTYIVLQNIQTSYFRF